MSKPHYRVVFHRSSYGGWLWGIEGDGGMLYMFSRVQQL